jgi:hypothetical protein
VAAAGAAGSCAAMPAVRKRVELSHCVLAQQL